MLFHDFEDELVSKQPMKVYKFVMSKMFNPRPIIN